MIVAAEPDLTTKGFARDVDYSARLTDVITRGTGGRNTSGENLGVVDVRSLDEGSYNVMVIGAGNKLGKGIIFEGEAASGVANIVQHLRSAYPRVIRTIYVAPVVQGSKRRGK